MLWHVLGPIEVRVDGAWAGVGAPKWRAVLAALLAEPDRVVATADLVDELWGENPQPGARKLVSGYVMRLRRLIGDPEGQVLMRQAPGYRLAAGRADLDACCFEDLLVEGRRALEREDADRADDLLTGALALWRGPALADVPRGPLATAEAGRLDELRLAAMELRIEAWIRCGRAGQLVAELRGLTAKHPLRERFWHQLMEVLEVSGRPAEALAAYAKARELIADELGADPGPDLQQLHQHLLDGGGITVSQPARIPRPAAAPWPRQAVVVPRQLPVAVQHFTGRHAGLAELTALSHATRGEGAAMAIAAIDGSPGIGKTALAVHWAHCVASQFPDGQLYVNLRGFDPSGRPAAPPEVIRDFLGALGTSAEQTPVSSEAQAALYRTLTTGKRLLIVLDNARDAAQVRPLLPASPGCLVLITSRSQLAGLVAIEGARLLTLDLLTEVEARELLALRLGAARLSAEPGAAAELIGLCARLPLALAIASARPGYPLSTLAAELRDTRSRLDALDIGDPAASIRAVFSWSYQQLTSSTARMFRLLGLHPGPDISARAAASLVGAPAAQARQELGELTRAHLITEHSPGRYSFHDLLRAYAAEQAAASDDDKTRRDALARALDHYLHTAYAAALLLNPSREPVTLSPPQTGAAPEQLADRQHALAWFEAEHDVLISAVAMAARTGFDACAWQLPWTMANFLDWRGHWQQWAATQRTALAAATRLGDTAGQAMARRHLAHSCAKLADYDQAHAHLTDCLGLYRQLGDYAGQAHVHQTLSWMSGRQDRGADALGHAEQALALFQITGDRAGQAEALNNVGCSHLQLGDYQQSHTFCRQALALYRELGDRPGEASSWDSLGCAEHLLGNLTGAADCYDRALSIFRELGNRYYQADTLTHLGNTHHAFGAQDKALDAWRQALEILDDLGHPDADQVRTKLGHAPASI